MAPLHVRLYSRPDCSVCEEAATVVEDFRGQFEFWLEKINIEEDPALKDRLKHQIPVITIDGGNRVAGIVNQDKIQRAFSKALQRQNEGHPPESPSE